MYLKTSYEREVCEQMKKAVGEWVASEHFTLFGTATYVHAHRVRVEKAHKDASHFARLLSRKVLGKHTVDRQGIYLPMLTFVEQGTNRDNTHIHFFTKGYTLKQTKGIIYNANRIWRTNIDCSLDVVIKDEHEAQRRTYTMKEQLAFDDEIISPKACFLPQN
jgi:hypothetical protein